MREVGQGSSWGTLSSCPHEFTFEFAFNLNVFLTVLSFKGNENVKVSDQSQSSLHFRNGVQAALGIS